MKAKPDEHRPPGRDRTSNDRRNTSGYENEDCRAHPAQSDTTCSQTAMGAIRGDSLPHDQYGQRAVSQHFLGFAAEQ